MLIPVRTTSLIPVATNFFDLRDNVSGRAAADAPAGERNRAITAKIIAPVLDFYKPPDAAYVTSDLKFLVGAEIIDGPDPAISLFLT